MLNNTVVIDVAIGLVFCFSSIALVASAVYEAIASALKLRAKSLLNGVKALLNDDSFTGLARELYNHALINPRDNGRAAPGKAPTVKPSYIAPRDFAYALVEVLQKGVNTSAALEASIDEIQDEQLKQLFRGMFNRAEKNVEKVHAELASWFDSAMERVSGAYKRQSQLFTFLIALAVAVLFNVDAFHLFRILWNHPALMAQISVPDAPNATQAISDLASLPLGWSAAPELPLIALCGWLTTASSALFGAPFWFDLLQRLVNLRGAGGKPRKVQAPVA